MICIDQSNSNLVRANYKFFIHVRGEALTELTSIHVKIVQLLGGVMEQNLWRREESSKSQKSVIFDSSVMW